MNAALSLPGMDVDALRTGGRNLEAALGTDSALAVDISEPEFLGLSSKPQRSSMYSIRLLRTLVRRDVDEDR